MTTAVLEQPVNADPACYRCTVGLVFPDGVRRCFTHSSDADDQLVSDLDARGVGIGLRRRRGYHAWPGSCAWPKGPDVEVAARGRLLDWAEARGLKRSSRSQACLRWLRTRCGCRSGCWDGCWADLRGRTATKAPPPTLVVDPTPEQAASIFGRGRPTKIVLQNPAFLPWVERDRPEFDLATLDRIGWLDHTSAWTRDGQPAVVVAHPYVLTGDAVETLSQLNNDPTFGVRVDQAGSWYGNGTMSVEVWRTTQ